MSATALTRPRARRDGLVVGLGAHRLIAAVLASRLLILAAGGCASIFARRIDSWKVFDPTRISSSLGLVGNALAASSVRWDSIHYLEIARDGYFHPIDASYFPLYPLLLRTVGWVIGSSVWAGMLISAVSFTIALLLLHRLTELELGRRIADATVLALAFAPLSFFFTAVYTESLYLVLSVGALYAARRERWVLAAALAMLAALTRDTGILLVVPIALMHFRSRGLTVGRLPWLALVPAGVFGFLFYLHSRGFGWLAPLHYESAYHRQFAGPAATVVAAARAALAGLRATLTGTPPFSPGAGPALNVGFENSVLLAVLLVAIAALAGAWRQLPRAYFAYALLTLVVCLWAPVTDGEPLQSLDRYVLTIFPLWMILGGWLAAGGATRILLLIGAGLLVFYTFEFASWAWVA